jgi:hypothetical protein
MTVEANSSPPIHHRNAGIARLLMPVVGAASAAGMGLSGMALLDSSICGYGKSPLAVAQHPHVFQMADCAGVLNKAAEFVSKYTVALG